MISHNDRINPQFRGPKLALGLPTFLNRLSSQELLQPWSAQISRPVPGLPHRLVALLRRIGTETRYHTEQTAQTTWRCCAIGAECSVVRRSTGAEDDIWARQGIHQGRRFLIIHLHRREYCVLLLNRSSPNSTRCNKPCPKEHVFPHSSPPSTRIIMQSFGNASVGLSL